MIICKICGSDCHIDVHIGTYYYYKCSHCHTSQLLPQPTKETLDQFYQEMFHKSLPEGGTFADFEARTRADFPTKVRLAKQFVNFKQARLLDVGCAKGFFIAEAVKQGVEAMGIELSQTAVEYAKHTLQVKAIQGDLPNMDKSGLEGQFEVITLWATIEHLPEPLLMLKAIYQCLKPNGILLMDTGLGNAPFEKKLLGHSQWYDAPQHLWVFSQEGIKYLLDQAGFQTILVDTNYERSYLRRIIKWGRHLYLCLFPFIVSRPFLGKIGFEKLKQEAKWPIGRLMLIVARKT